MPNLTQDIVIQTADARSPCSKRCVRALSLLTISLLAIILISCKGTPDPSISPLAIESSAIASTPSFLVFDVPRTVVGMDVPATIEKQFRIDGIVAMTRTETIAITLPEVAGPTTAQDFVIGEWLTSERGEEWIRATAIVTVEGEPLIIAGKTYIGDIAQTCDNAGFCFAMAVTPYRIFMPLIASQGLPGG